MKLDGDSAMLGMLQAAILLLRAFFGKNIYSTQLWMSFKASFTKTPKLLAKSKLCVKIDKGALGEGSINHHHTQTNCLKVVKKFT